MSTDVCSITHDATSSQCDNFGDDADATRSHVPSYTVSLNNGNVICGPAVTETLLYEFLQVKQIGFVTLGPLRCA